MKHTWLITLLVLNTILLSCTNDREPAPAPTRPKPTNDPPAAFTVEVSDITKSTALISWTEATDPEKDKVTYSVVLDGRELATDLDSASFVAGELAPETRYEGYVLAHDPQKNSARSNFFFTTKSPYTTFSRHYSIGDDASRTGSLCKTSDDGYVIAGTTYKPGLDQWIMFVMKIDSVGDEQWKVIHELNIAGEKVAVSETMDRGFILAARNFILKTDAKGNVLWKKEILLDCVFSSVIEASDGSIVVIGEIGRKKAISQNVTTQALLLKLDAGGNQLWEKRYGSSKYSMGRDIVQTPSGGFVLLCQTEYSGAEKEESERSIDRDMDFWVISTDPSGNIHWQKTYGDRRYDFAAKLKATKDGGYVIGGSSWGAYDFSDMRVIRIDGSGSALLDKSIDNGFSFQTGSIALTDDGGYALTGYVKSVYDIFFGIYKLDSGGNKEWEHWYGREWEGSYGVDLLQNPDKGYMVAGYSAAGYFDHSQVWVLKLDPQGRYEE
ncbi:hypothetical protein GCM10023188_47390 [Pontibacter saemangeumensis]|uniref:Fibronectin type-III domain-containing protein n=1 Tax=Pontibacter saemangeumensis TaxID=1084525 RepID=A0ABP8M5H6_9BACT